MEIPDRTDEVAHFVLGNPNEIIIRQMVKDMEELDRLRAENERLKADVDTCSEVLKISEQERERISKNAGQLLAEADFEKNRISNTAATRNTELVIECQTLQAENKRLAKCCTLRGARMQIMRDWMKNTPLSSDWREFLANNMSATTWFDDDGVPK